MIVMLGAVHVGIGLVALIRPEVLAAGRADLLLNTPGLVRRRDPGFAGN